VRKYEAALGRRGDKEAGELVYKRLCGRCHTFRSGSNYGPDLWTVSSRPPRRILIDILLPSNSMAPGRELFMIDLKGGGSVDGVIGSQTATSINVLHDESRQETVLREDILRLLMSDFSAMPVDLASQITVQQMADLLRFLTSR
jgi:putative heme-binding domain-containing protein